MASRKTVTTENLTVLGVERLANILVGLAEERADIKRRLRLELAGKAGGEAIAEETSKRLTSLKSARSFIDWEKRREFVKELDLQRETITERVAETRPDLALDLMWRFLELAEPILQRVDDSNGTVGGVFHLACRDLGTIAAKARPAAAVMANKIFAAVTSNDYGQYDGLIQMIFPILGKTGVAHLKARLSEALAKRPKDNQSRHDSHASRLTHALQAIADGEGDVDAYVALTPAQSRRAPRIAAEIARRLLAAGRADEAMAALHEGTPRERQQADDDDGLAFYNLSGDYEWDEAYIDALLATDRKEEAQKVRWAGFERDLSVDRLRAYLKTLPDFEDVIAEDKAMDYALRFGNATSALNFFIEWPNPCHAEKLVLARHAEIDGNAYYLLDPAARLLEGARPLAATVLRRAMIDDTLDGAKSGRYRHAARHLLECQSLDRDIKDYGSFETHAAFVTRIRAKHSRKTGFWARVSELSGMRTA